MRYADLSCFSRIRFFRRLLPERWGRLSRWLGGMVYCVSPLAETGRDNFRHVLGPDADPDSVSELARMAFEKRLLDYYEMLWLSGRSLDQIDWPSKFDGSRACGTGSSLDRGLIVTAAHIWDRLEYMIQGVTALAYPFIGIMEQLPNERIHRYMMGLRSAHGLEMISTQGPLLEVYRRLKRGEVLLTAVDRDSTGRASSSTFLALPRGCPMGMRGGATGRFAGGFLLYPGAQPMAPG